MAPAEDLHFAMRQDPQAQNLRVSASVPALQPVEGSGDSRIDRALFASGKLRREPHGEHASFKIGRSLAGIVGDGGMGYGQPAPRMGNAAMAVSIRTALERWADQAGQTHRHHEQNGEEFCKSARALCIDSPDPKQVGHYVLNSDCPG